MHTPNGGDSEALKTCQNTIKLFKFISSARSRGLSKVGCQADFVYKHSIVFAGLLEKESILELINDISMSGDFKKNKQNIPQQKVVVLATTAFEAEGGFHFLVCTTQNYNYFLRHSKFK